MDDDRVKDNQAHPIASHKDGQKTLIIASVTVGLIIIMTLLLFSSGNFAGEATQIDNDCGTNFTCFLNEAKDCNPVVVTQTLSLDLLGVNVTSTGDFTVYGVVAEKCNFKQTVTAIDLSFTEQLVQNLLDNGATIEEIEAQEEISLNYAKEQIGSEISCQYPLTEYSEMLSTWETDNFTLLEEEYCSGFGLESEVFPASYSIETEKTNLSCQDSDLDNITTKGTTTGLELDLTDTTKNTLSSKQDSCYDSSLVVEYLCDENGFIDYQLKTCPESTICLDGACIAAPPLLNAEDVSKTTTKIIATEEIDKPFWIVTTLLDESDKIILFNRMLHPSLEKDLPYNHIVNYPNLDQVKTKKVIIYDINDPSKWTVYLNQTFEVEYTGLS